MAERDTDARPRSAVSAGVGYAGVAGLGAWTIWCHRYGLNGPYAALIALAAGGLPMVLWSLLVDRVHRAPSTGIDWSLRRPWGEVFDTALVKLAGLWATWGLVAVGYAIGRWYWNPPYLFAMHVLAALAPALVVLSLPYVLWIERRLVVPQDDTWRVGRLLVGDGWRDGQAQRALADHARAWAVKGFFTAFMLSTLPGNWQAVLAIDPRRWPDDVVALAEGLIAVMFLVDVMLATVGYLLTLRPLDAHIRSANPLAAGWTAALICYPPFVLMGDGGPLDYAPGRGHYSGWLAGHPWLLSLDAFALIALTGIYAWATVSFGLRFSNLTHRGILTHGPYAWSRHPAYLAKNLFWWLSTLPFLATTGSWIDAVRNSAILALIGGVYFWRARTEERHLSVDPAYIAYRDWSERHAPVTRTFARLVAVRRR